MTTHKSGIALDIDDTLSQTLLYWIGGLQEKFGGPVDLRPEEIVTKYKHTRNVPQWNTPEALAYIGELCNADDLQEAIPVVEGSVEGVKRINAIVPIVAYVTARPDTVLYGTTQWLKKHGFPNAPIIARPKSVHMVDGIQWKTQTLIDSFPQILGIVDNDIVLANRLSLAYQGYVFLFADEMQQPISRERVYLCPDWTSVVHKVEKVFSNR